MLDRDIWDRPAVLTTTLLVVAYVLYQLLRPSKLPKIPIVGAKPREWFPLQRAKWRNTMDMKAATEIAYNQYSDRACIFPIAGAQNFVHLPYKELQWLVDRPETDIDVRAQIIDSLQLNRTLTDPKLAHYPAHISLISGRLTREISNLVPDLLDEIQYGVDNLWGSDGENYKTICVYDLMSRIVGRVTNRVFVGLPLCRDPVLLDAAMAFSLDIPIASTLLHFVWPPLRPLLAPFITLPNRIHTNRFFRIVRPEIRRRLKDYDARRTDPSIKAAEKEPHDFLQWSIDQAKSLDDPYYGKVDTLAGRVLLNNFTSIHTSSFAITHVILDLASAKQEYIDELRDEITSVLAEYGGQWNKRALAAMPKLDSVMRESARLNSFVVTATNRKVVNPKGITTPSGTHLPEGTLVCGPSFPVIHDPVLYPESYTFKPFRFAENRAALAEEGESHVQRARQALTTTSPEFAAFGHGRHACAGRFFAASTLKLMLAYIVLNYDFEIQEKRAENVWFGSNRIPPMKAFIRVKRRTEK